MPTLELAACQVYVNAADYASEGTFAALLERVGRRLDAARARRADGTFAHACLAVFPELIGAFLPLCGRLDVVRGATTTDGAFARVAVRTLPSLLRAMARARTWSPRAGLLLAAAPEVERVYAGAFARFAAAHACWVVAGSALLPRAAGGGGDAAGAGDARVYNTSYAFAPDGRRVGVTRKVNLVPTLEDAAGLGLAAGSVGELAPLETPFARVGTLVCYDGFRVAHTRREPAFQAVAPRLDALGCTVLAQPAANPWAWEGRWFFAEAGETQRRREQWMNEGLLGQLRRGRWRNVRFGVTAHLVGQVLDRHFEGQSQIFERAEAPAGGPAAVRVLAEAARADATPEAEEVVLRAVELAASRDETAAPSFAHATA
jgi:predicted amidohydrolase